MTGEGTRGPLISCHTFQVGDEKGKSEFSRKEESQEKDRRVGQEGRSTLFEKKKKTKPVSVPARLQSMRFVYILCLS